jgi:hypothetical protein
VRDQSAQGGCFSCCGGLLAAMAPLRQSTPGELCANGGGRVDVMLCCRRPQRCKVVLVEQEDVGDDRTSLETVMEASAEIMLHKAGDVQTDHTISWSPRFGKICTCVCVFVFPFLSCSFLFYILQINLCE